MLTKIDELRIDAYIVLVLAKEKSLDEVPEKYRKEVELQVAHKTLEILGSGE